MPTNSKNGTTFQSMIEKTMQIKPVDWDITIHITYNAVMDDRTGALLTKARQAAGNFNRHVNQLVFQAINTGATIGAFGACYDGKALFDANHIDPGAFYQTAQSNVNTLALTPVNFQTVYVASSQRLGDQGQQTGYVPDLLIVPPALDYAGAQITGNPKTPSTTMVEGEINPYAGRISQITVPYIDSTAWYLVDSSMPIKPLFVVMRQRPTLQEAWFDATKPDGGWYMFKYFGRYNVAFGDWRLIAQGNT
jgi:phage major head subunit gpT-like protein